MIILTQSKYENNKLLYSARRKEYVFVHEGKEIWREQADNSLANYFKNNETIFSDELEQYPIWNKYCKSCDDLFVLKHAR